ncbi:MAG: DnaD domain protein [Clostridium sp.]
MAKGYIKLYRQIQDTSIWADSNKLKLWLLCLLKATHDGRTQIVGNQTINLEPGQFITGRNDIADDFNRGAKRCCSVDGQTLFRWLKLFENLKMLNIKSTNKYTIVTLLNWDKYQSNEQQMNIKRTSNEHQMNTNKNEKNDKNDLKEENFKEEKSDSVPNADSALLTSDDEKSSIGNHIERIESILGKTLSPNDLQALVEYRQSLPDEVIAKAIDIAKTNKARNFRYIDKILNDWKQSKVKSVADVEILLAVRVKDQKAQTTKQLPDWFNNPNAVQVDTSDFDEEEMLRDLEELRVLKEGAA